MVLSRARKRKTTSVCNWGAADGTRLLPSSGLCNLAAPENHARFLELRLEVLLQVLPDQRGAVGVRNTVHRIGQRVARNQRSDDLRVGFDPADDIALAI